MSVSTYHIDISAMHGLTLVIRLKGSLHISPVRDQ